MAYILLVYKKECKLIHKINGYGYVPSKDFGVIRKRVKYARSCP